MSLKELEAKSRFQRVCGLIIYKIITIKQNISILDSESRKKLWKAFHARGFGGNFILREIPLTSERQEIGPQRRLCDFFPWIVPIECGILLLFNGC